MGMVKHECYFVLSVYTSSGSAENGSSSKQRANRAAEPPQTSHVEAGDSHVSVCVCGYTKVVHSVFFSCFLHEVIWIKKGYWNSINVATLWTRVWAGLGIGEEARLALFSLTFLSFCLWFTGHIKSIVVFLAAVGFKRSWGDFMGGVGRLGLCTLD